MRLPNSVAILGKGLDLTYESKGKLFKYDCHGLAVCGDADRRTLWLWAWPSKVSRRTLAQLPTARRLREDWSELEADDEVLSARPRVSNTTRRLGVVTTIGYRSDKYTGKNDDYEHRYDHPPVLEQSGNVLRIRGGRQRITPDGIRG